jgi:hypothetical protein
MTKYFLDEMTAFAGRMIYSGHSSKKIWVSFFSKSFLYAVLLVLCTGINMLTSTDQRPSWKHIVAQQVKKFSFYTSHFSILYSQGSAWMKAQVILILFWSSNPMSSINCVRVSFLCHAWCVFQPNAPPWFNHPHNIWQKHILRSSLLCNILCPLLLPLS